LREKRRLNRVLKIIFGPKRGWFTREWRKLDHEERTGLYSPNIIRVIKSRGMRWVGNVARMGRGRGEPHTELWQENLREMDWIDLAQDMDRLRTLVNEVMNFRVPSND
jgi:hypothetical protein